jgi:hypothetical protein
MERLLSQKFGKDFSRSQYTRQMRKLGLLALLLAAGCSSGPEMQLLGHWTGGFVSDHPSATTNFEGFLHLYRTEYKFKMEIHNSVQTLKVDGTWILKGSEIDLIPTTLDTDEPTEEEIAAKSLKVFDMEKIGKELGKSFVLRVSPDYKQASGPTFSLGDTRGTFEFTHAVQSSYTK